MSTEEQLAALQQRLAAMETSLQTMVNTTTTAATATAAQVNGVLQTQATVAESLASITNTLRDLEGKVRTYDTRVQGLTQAVGDQRAETLALQDICPDSDLLSVDKWEPKHFQTPFQRGEWLRRVEKIYNDDRGMQTDLEKHIRDRSEIERQLKKLKTLVATWAVIRTTPLPYGHDTVKDAMKVIQGNTAQMIHEIFAELQLLRIKLHPEGGVEEMKRIEEKRKQQNLPPDLQAEMEEVRKNYQARHTSAQVILAAHKLQGGAKKGGAPAGGT